jgi:cardiolipin synthase
LQARIPGDPVAAARAINLPNLFTLVRLALTPFVAVSILGGNYERALIMFFLAGISDGLDGFLARRLNKITTLGAYLDPVADKILLATIYISLGAAGAIPWWMVAVVFGRDILILGMVAWGLIFTSLRNFSPTILGKASTVLQIAAALGVMAGRAGVAMPVDLLLWMMIGATVWSGIHYAWRGVTMLRAEQG